MNSDCCGRATRHGTVGVNATRLQRIYATTSFFRVHSSAPRNDVRACGLMCDKRTVVFFRMLFVCFFFFCFLSSLE